MPARARDFAAIALALVGGEAWAASRSAVVPGDARSGEAIYTRCAACHALAYDRTGPRHCGLFGRQAGSVPGFAYSSAMKKSQIVWNERTLDRFLASPTTVVPGTAMGYAGIADKKERADLIAYLKKANESPPCAK
jgi:cytochrome c